MTLVEHARRELELCGQTAEDPAYSEAIVNAVAAFAAYGHSGGSAGCAREQLHALLGFQTLSPLTDDPAEWFQVTDQCWQSRRQPSAFSVDGGVTHYVLPDGDATAGIPTRPSKVSGKRPSPGQ